MHLISVSLIGTLRLQARPSKRPPRFYVPEKALQFSQPGATFQLGTEETHHALKYAQLAMLSSLTEANLIKNFLNVSHL